MQAGEDDYAFNLMPQLIKVVSQTLYLASQLLDGPLVVENLLSFLARVAFVFIDAAVSEVRVNVVQLRGVILVS